VVVDTTNVSAADREPYIAQARARGFRIVGSGSIPSMVSSCSPGNRRSRRDLRRARSPFDRRFHDLMLETTSHLMQCGFDLVYGYTESDEISLLFRRDESTFGRKLRKIISVLAGEASAKFSILLDDVACFDCRISQLPSDALVIDYFRWRSEDAHRNALNAHAYWMLRKEGKTARAATAAIEGMSVADKNELLFSRGVNFDSLPAWQKRGSGLHWETYEKHGVDPRTGSGTKAMRRRLRIDEELPRGDAYAEYLRRFL
jgi:tRNA(His) guanylyltransferase